MASSSSVIYGYDNHDVFLSFRGSDTRNNFTSHLYNALCHAKIKVFIDNSLNRGEEITPALHRVIESAKISVIVFSSDYTSSTFCLDEAAKIIECRESKAQIVLPIFYKVDPSEIRKQKGSYGEAFAIHEAKFKGKNRLGGMEKVERWKWALCRAADLSGWHLDHNSNEAESIQTIVGDISKLLSRQSKNEELIIKPLNGLSTVTATLEKIWQCLMNDDTSRVGVYGMGGVGKTTIATHIYNRLRDADSFQHVHWVTVTKESSIYKLQTDIAKETNLDLSRENDERKRAAKLSEALNDRKKFLLILDDMWESFELDEVGIPSSVDGKKILLTTRKRGVCTRIKCEEIVKVEPLSEQEARDLFIRESGHQLDDNPELRNIVESVAKECDGLPLAVVAIARSTREFVEIYEWRNILRELQKPSIGKNLEMEEKVFKLLKISYDRLPNDQYRQCLLYCALYPEDCAIVRNELIDYWIGEGLIDELECRQAELDMGNCMINQLIDASLLERDGRSRVKMHDVVRDMALTITRKNFLVKAGLQIKDFPKFTDWSVNLERISVIDIRGLERCPFNLAPNCSKLKTLLVQWNNDLTELPDCFFVNMQNLTVLDMSYLLSLRLLPGSISMLENLRLLNLYGCRSLEHIPSLAGLENLWHLDLSRTNLKEIPKDMEKLVNLKVLHIRHVEPLYGLIPSKFLKQLSLLQSLKLDGSNIEVEPSGLVSLQNLESLAVGFKNYDALNLYLKSRHWQRLKLYFFYNRKRIEINDKGVGMGKKLLLCKDRDSDSDSKETDTVFPNDVQLLGLMHWDIPLDGAFRNGNFAHLNRLILNKCRVNYLISVAFAQQLLRNLEYLELLECTYIEEIIATEEESLNQSNLLNYPTIQLPKLKALYLKNLPRLRRIYRGMMELPSLKILFIDKCEKLERLPFCEKVRDSWKYY